MKSDGIDFTGMKKAIQELLDCLGNDNDDNFVKCKCVVKKTDIPGMGIIYYRCDCPYHGHFREDLVKQFKKHEEKHGSKNIHKTDNELRRVPF
jgi:hypothetical protein